MMDKQEYQHKEAFCLMVYQCKNCKGTEQFWNSRDGVTPFGIRCDVCGGDLLHIGWRSDICKPHYIPYVNQGVFITMPHELRTVFARQRIRSADGTDFELQGDEREKMIAAIAKGFHEGEPMLIRWR